MWLIGLGGSAADVVPVGIVTVIIEIEVDVVGVMVHGGMLAWVKWRPVVAETESHCLLKQTGSHS